MVVAPQTKLDHALQLAQRGFRVFPLIENGKLPAIQGWPKKATTDPNQIKQWWGADPHTGWRSDRNIGVLTGGGLAVLDVDNKHGISGDESLRHLTVIDELPHTFTTKSPGRSTHIYLIVNNEIRNSAAKIAPGLDVRGHHGFVVGPGSTINDGDYEIVTDSPIAPAPQWLEQVFSKARPVVDRQKADSEAAARIELDTPDAIARAKEYLVTAEPAIEGAGGDDHAFRIACRVKDFGVTEATTVVLMLEHWAERCVTSRAPGDFAEYISTKVQNAYAHGTSPVGVASPQLDFEPVTLGTPAQKGLYFELAKDMEPDSNTAALIENYLDQHAFSVIYGESNTGKTFVALDIAFHVATGRMWATEGTTQGGVVYVAAEGGRGIRKRIKALRTHFGIAEPPIAVVPCSINLLGRNADTKALGTLIDRAALALGMPVVLIVIDTLARAMAGGNENASEDMGAFVQAVDAIRATSQAHVMVVHHSGKDTAKGARGHSSLRAATDTELEIVDSTLQVRKQRDGEYATARPFRLVTVDLGVTRTGKPLTSCVVTWCGTGEEFDEVPLTPDERHCYEALQTACEALPAPADGVALDAVASAYGTLGLPAPNERTLRRWLVALETKGHAGRTGTTKKSRWRLH